MQELCEKYNLNYEFIEAVDGRTLSEVEIEKIYSKEKVIKAIGREMSRSEIGVLLSQKSIYEKILKENIDNALIFEDDIEFDQRLITVLNEIENFPKYWNLILLGHHSPRGRDIETSYSLWGQEKVTDKFKLARPAELGFGAYGYLLKKSAAKVLLEELNEIEKPLDHITGSDEKLNLYVLIPAVVDIHQDLSENYHNMHDRKELIKSIEQKNKKYFTLKRKALIFLHLDKLWDNLPKKYTRLKNIIKMRRTYKPDSA